MNFVYLTTNPKRTPEATLLDEPILPGLLREGSLPLVFAGCCPSPLHGYGFPALEELILGSLQLGERPPFDLNVSRDGSSPGQRPHLFKRFDM